MGFAGIVSFYRLRPQNAFPARSSGIFIHPLTPEFSGFTVPALPPAFLALPSFPSFFPFHSLSSRTLPEHSWGGFKPELPVPGTGMIPSSPSCFPEPFFWGSIPHFPCKNTPGRGEVPLLPRGDAGGSLLFQGIFPGNNSSPRVPLGDWGASIEAASPGGRGTIPSSLENARIHLETGIWDVVPLPRDAELDPRAFPTFLCGPDEDGTGKLRVRGVDGAQPWFGWLDGMKIGNFGRDRARERSGVCYSWGRKSSGLGASGGPWKGRKGIFIRAEGMVCVGIVLETSSHRSQSLRAATAGLSKG